MTRSYRLVAAWSFVVLAAATFVVRGPARATYMSDDLAPVYGAARAWIQGENPYDGAELTRALFEGGREGDGRGRQVEGGAVYAPFTIAATSPLALFSWPDARMVFLMVSLALIAWHIPTLLQLSGATPREPYGVALLGGVLALAPYHTGIAYGQLAIPAVALIVTGIHAVRSGRATAGGILLAVAVMLKPQLAAPFVLYCALRGHGRAAWVAAAGCLGAAAVGIGWMEANDVSWFSSWRSSLADVAANPEHDPAGSHSAQLVDARPLLALLVMGAGDAGGAGGAGGLAGTAAFGLAAAAGVYAYVLGRRLGAEHDLLILACVSVLTLLATYHRFYDAAVLCIPLAWGITAWREKRSRRLAGGAVIAVAVFFMPGAWMLQRWADAGAAPALTRSWLWDAVLLRHQNWALVALAVLLLLALGRSQPAARRETVPDSRR